MTARSVAGVALLGLALAGCSANGLSFDASSEAPDPTVSMTGRWMLAEPNAPPCGMAFTGAVNAREGTITPDGGCPGNFYTSRHWTFEQGELVIKGDNDEPLAHLKLAGGTHFDGSANNGVAVTLTRAGG